MKNQRVNSVSVILAIIAMMIHAVALAGNWHIGQSLACQECHIEHASESGLPTPGGPFSSLLVKSSVNDLCLSCHDGTNPSAPDILLPIDMYQTTSSGESSGGFVMSPGFDHAGGHSIGLPVAVPLNNQGKTMTLSCVSCHAYHGNENYRNLAYDPDGVGDSLVVKEGVDVFTQTLPAVPPTRTGSIAAYSRDNVGYKSNYTRWCASCHNQLASPSSAILPAHFNDHPNEVAINAYSPSTHTDPSHWVTGTGDGFPTTGGIPRVPFVNATATDFNSAKTVSASNKVFCLSCHKPHGSSSQRALLWPYFEGGTNYVDGCQQCHNK
jgi:Doubled CXXCH motif (Paired_CXXCH_1)